jgi:hypothetical protein
VLCSDQVNMLTAHAAAHDTRRTKAMKQKRWEENHLVFISSAGTVIRPNNLTHRH